MESAEATITYTVSDLDWHYAPSTGTLTIHLIGASVNFFIQKGMSIHGPINLHLEIPCNAELIKPSE